MARRPFFLEKASPPSLARGARGGLPLFLSAFFCLQLLLPGLAVAELRVTLRADRVESDRATGVSTATGNVRLEVEGAVITTDHLRFHQNERIVETDAPFTLVQKGTDGKVQTITGTGLSYELNSEKATVQGAKLEIAAKTPGQVVYISGKELISYARREFEVHEGTFTTCDFISKQETPHYHAQCGWIKYVPDDYAMGTNVLAYVNNQPAFWVPWFYVPLKRRESTVQAGKNNIEGYFLKTTMAYRLNDRHYGNLYLSGLQNMMPGGLGFDHVWDNGPNSMTAATFYGLVLPDMQDYVDSQGALTVNNPWIVHGFDPTKPSVSFQDHYWRVRHQQRLFSQMTLDGWYEDRNIYDLVRPGASFMPESLKTNPRQNYRDDHYAYHLGLTDNRMGLNYGANRTFKEDRGFTRMRSQTDTANVSGTFGGTNFSSRTNRSQQTSLPPWTAWDAGRLISTGTPSVTNTQTNNFQLNQTFSNNLRGNFALDHTRNEYPGQSRQERLTQSMSLTQSLGWGTATLAANRLYNLNIPPTATETERKTAIAALNNVDKWPELSITTNPLLEQFQPFTLSGVYGLYTEGSAYDPVAALNSPNPALRLEPVGRIKLRSELTSKPLDLGLGAKLNFGSTGYEQRFYTTGDAEYQMSGQAILTNDITKYFNTSLTYHQDYTPPATGSDQFRIWGSGINASPFKQFESLSISKTHTLSGAANAVYEEAFSWTNSLSYNYEIKRYTPYSTAITFKPSRRVNLSINTGYTFADKPYLEFGTGKWSSLNSTLHLQSGDQGFGGLYGENHLIPGWSLDSTVAWDVDTGVWQGFTSKLILETGDSWQSHWALVGEASYNPSTKLIELTSIGLNKDLHDFILSVSYNKRLESYTLNLAMVAFPTDLINLSNKSFGGLGSPEQLANQLGSQLGVQGGF